MRWLVTGGVGFIGYHVSRALLGRGDQVVIADDFSDAPYPRAEKLRNERDLTGEFTGVRIVRGCVTDREAMAPLVAGCDGILHLPGLAGARGGARLVLLPRPRVTATRPPCPVGKPRRASCPSRLTPRPSAAPSW